MNYSTIHSSKEVANLDCVSCTLISVIPVKNSKSPNLTIHAPSTARRRGNSGTTPTGNSQNDNNHQSSKIKNGTTMTSSSSNHRIGSSSNLHHNNNNGVPTSHSVDGLKHAVGSTNGSNANSGATTRSKATQGKSECHFNLLQFNESSFLIFASCFSLL
jgi:hypothetical protein